MKKVLKRRVTSVRASALIIGSFAITLAMLSSYDTAAAKNNNMSVKMSPEYTRQKSGGGKVEDTTAPGLKKLPGKKKPPTLTLKRGLSAD
jgi:hypothetical protein